MGIGQLKLYHRQNSSNMTWKAHRVKVQAIRVAEGIMAELCIAGACCNHTNRIANRAA